MKRFAMSALLTLVALLAITNGADAGLGWCRRDPIVVLNGVRVQILVAIPQEYEWNVTGPIQVVVSTPPGVSRQLVSTDAGFNGLGEQVYWGDLNVAASGGFPVSIYISVPTNLSFSIPMQVDVIPDAGSPATVGGDNIGLTVTAHVAGSTLTTHAVHGADAGGGSPVGSSATPATVDPGSTAPAPIPPDGAAQTPPASSPTTEPPPTTNPVSPVDAARAEARALRERRND
jgi:hypothetical protein